MIPAADLAPRVLGDLLREQPLSEAKVRLAWETAVGPAMARATSVRLGAADALLVTTRTDAWRDEVTRSLGLIRRRLAAVLGQGVVTRIVVTREGDAAASGATPPSGWRK